MLQCSGRCVDDILIEDERLYSQSYILDLSDKDIQNMFTVEEWTEIEIAAKPRPPERTIPDLPDLDSLFSVGCNLLQSSDKFEAWLGLTLVQAHRLYSGTFLSASHREGTFVQIWSNFIDQSLLGRGFHVSRGEIESNSIKQLLNNGRTLADRVVNSCKFDAIIFSDLDANHKEIEYGFHEASKDHATSYDSKLVGDTGKVVMAMRAAIVHGSTVFMHEKDFQTYEVLSVVTSGLQLRCLHMSYGGGMVTLLQRGSPVKLPQTFHPVKFRQALMEVIALSDMWLRNNSSPDLRGGSWARQNVSFELPW
ncbi:hypothetical protein RUND412_002394 [Rhizina undulata]